MPGFRPDSVTVHPNLLATFVNLETAARAGKKPEASIWKALQTNLGRIKLDAGEVIPRSSIPAHFRRTFGVENLYCIDLAGFRRAFYTIDEYDVVLLALVDHAQYDKWFPDQGR